MNKKGLARQGKAFFTWGEQIDSFKRFSARNRSTH